MSADQEIQLFLGGLVMNGINAIQIKHQLAAMQNELEEANAKIVELTFKLDKASE